ncbi:MAG: hypothetical protein QXD03_03190 [Candidatus Anstonellales archaeon]
MFEEGIIFYVNEKNGYKYFNVGSGRHGKVYHVIYLGKNIDQDLYKDGKIKFPIDNHKIIRTQKGTLILIPDSSSWCGSAYIKCGYRGSSHLTLINPRQEDFDVYLRFEIYRSQVGSLGISEGYLFSLNKNISTVVKYEYKRTGRTYGSDPEGGLIITPDGINIVNKEILSDNELEEIAKV